MSEKKITRFFIVLISSLLLSCDSMIDVDLQEKSTLGESNLSKNDSAPVTSDLSLNRWFKDIERTITLTYTDPDSDEASSCSISGLTNLTVTTPCSCMAGVCSIGVTGTTGYTGLVSFNYMVTANNQNSIYSSVNFTLGNLGASDSEEWVRIPEDTGGMGLSEFYVMKYEAKAWNDGNSNLIIDAGEVDADGQAVVLGSNTPVSIEDNQPWRDMDANQSAAKCESLGANFHLISNSEWMAIARDIENVNGNWTGGTVGSGCLFRGNSGDTSCGYNSATDPDSGGARNTRAKHTLSTGDEIFDISGNLAEWTDWNSSDIGFQIGPTTCTGGITQLPSVACGDLASADFDTDNGTFTTTQGVGVFVSGTGGAALRGGYFGIGGIAGIFMLTLDLSATDAGDYIGFRCVFRP